MMTIYFNRVHNYSQDCSLPYGPMYETTLQHDQLQQEAGLAISRYNQGGKSVLVQL